MKLRLTIYFYQRRAQVEAHLTLKRWNIPFVNNVKYIGVIFNRKTTWRISTETKAKVFPKFVRIYPLSKSERLSDNTKKLYKALIKSVMIYACPALEFAADSHLFKLQHLQNEVLRTNSNLPGRTQTRDFHVAFKILYIYILVTKLCRKQAEVTQNHKNVNVRNIGQSESQTKKQKVKLSLDSTDHHSMKAYWGRGCIAPCVRDLGIRWRRVVSFKLMQLYPQVKNSWYPLDRRLKVSNLALVKYMTFELY
jgi:hypothetical protein